MGRKARPWYWKEQQIWCVYIEGRRYKLGREKNEAEDKYHELMANRHDLTPSVPVVHVLDRYLGWLERRRAKLTYEWYKIHLTSFAKHIGKRLSVLELKPLHVTSWIDAAHAKASPTTIRGAVGSVQRAFNWAIREGHIGRNPVIGVEKPAATKREILISEKQFACMLENATDQQERDLLEYLWSTGCRVQEVRAIENRHLDLDEARVVFPPSEAKGKKLSRVIYMNDTAIEIATRLSKQWPQGPIFRNSKNEPWDKNSIRCRFRKFGTKGLCGTAFRHTWITSALQRGVDPVTVAVLCGHTDILTLSRHYQHLAKKPQYLREQVRKATDQAVAV